MINNLEDCMYSYRYESDCDEHTETCDQCGEDICYGDEYWDISGDIYCSYCLEGYRHVV